MSVSNSDKLPVAQKRGGNFRDAKQKMKIYLQS